MIIPKGALQRRLHEAQVHANRESVSLEQKARGIILNVYSLKDTSIPDMAYTIVQENPGLLVVEVLLLTGNKVYIPLESSPDEREMLYGNSRNLRHRPVEIRFFGSNIEKGRAYISSDPLSVNMSESEFPKVFDVFGSIS